MSVSCLWGDSPACEWECNIAPYWQCEGRGAHLRPPGGLQLHLGLALPRGRGRRGVLHHPGGVQETGARPSEQEPQQWKCQVRWANFSECVACNSSIHILSKNVFFDKSILFLLLVERKVEIITHTRCCCQYCYLSFLYTTNSLSWVSNSIIFKDLFKMCFKPFWVI